jgi:hypothetical protein
MQDLFKNGEKRDLFNKFYRSTYSKLPKVFEQTHFELKFFRLESFGFKFSRNFNL